MGRVHKRKNRVRTSRGTREGAGAWAGKQFRRTDGTVVKVLRRVPCRNRVVYEASVKNQTVRVTAKALRKMTQV